jgi:hypothetical protein
MTALLWLTRDLRVHDHPALRAALDRCERVVPVFCFDDRLLGGRHASGCTSAPTRGRSRGAASSASWTRWGCRGSPIPGCTSSTTSASAPIASSRRTTAGGWANRDAR